VSKDECWGISHVDDTTFAAALTIKMSEIRMGTKGDFQDILLMVMDNSGDLKKSAVISQGSLAQSMYLSGNGLIV
jgi:hypothetical protein